MLLLWQIALIDDGFFRRLCRETCELSEQIGEYLIARRIFRDLRVHRPEEVKLL